MMTLPVKGLKLPDVSSRYFVNVLKDVAIAPIFRSGNTKPHKHTRALAHYFNVVRTKA